MASWTDPTVLRRDLSRAVLRPERLNGHVVREARPVPAPLSVWVEQVWSLVWTKPVPSTSSVVIAHPT